MKKSEFTSFIKEEIINILSEDNHDEKSILAKAKAQAELNKELEKTKDLVGEDEEDDKDAVKVFNKIDLTKGFNWRDDGMHKSRVTYEVINVQNADKGISSSGTPGKKS